MSRVTFAADTNQARSIGQFAIDFMTGSLNGSPAKSVLDRTKLFHTDAVLCGLSAIALGTNAPNILRNEALTYLDAAGATVFGDQAKCKAEKAICANAAAVREWDSNGTNFGYRPELGHTAGEFGHNDFYAVAVAACQQQKRDGATALKAMVLLDEIRGRLAEVFSLKTYKIDHVVHGAIASAATYGAVMGAKAEQIESAIGMFVAHYIPWRAIRAGKQLSDSKGASAAISTEAAILCMKRSMEGFLGPQDIFRNPESMFRQFEKTSGHSPFELHFSFSGEDFAVMGMHFKLGLYEHQSAGALQGLIDLARQNPQMLDPGAISSITVKAYEPAFGIIGDPAKRDPKTRQSADHSMVYILATLLRKAVESRSQIAGSDNDQVWKLLMLSPYDYHADAIVNSETRKLMELIQFEHGGPEYDARYPDGIPTSIQVTLNNGQRLDSGLVMHPSGHARNTFANLEEILDHKFKLLGDLAFDDRVERDKVISRLENLESLDASALQQIYDCRIAMRPGYE